MSIPLHFCLPVMMRPFGSEGCLMNAQLCHNDN